MIRLQGHRIDPERIYAVQWVLGVIGIAFAFLLGIFILLGGAQGLTGELYQPLMSTFGDYHVIGAVNVLGGILGVIGLGLDLTKVSITSAALCAFWNGMLAFYVIPANWTVPGGGNILGFYAALIMVIYLLRIVLLVAKPGPDAMKLR